MHFRALSLPAEEPGSQETLVNPAEGMNVTPLELRAEVSDFLCATTPTIDNCFEFDLGDIVEGCQKDL